MKEEKVDFNAPATKDDIQSLRYGIEELKHEIKSIKKDIALMLTMLDNHMSQHDLEKKAGL